MKTRRHSVISDRVSFETESSRRTRDNDNPVTTSPPSQTQSNPKMSLRILCLGAHPDDCEYFFGGTAFLLAQAGHQVHFASLTNGDAGHPTLSGPVLAQRRKREAEESIHVLGVKSYTMLPSRDGRLEASIETREQVVRLVRTIKADVLFTHRMYDYHPDHRTTGRIVLDALTMLGIPSFVPEVPKLERAPVLLFLWDRFRRPYPHQAEVVVDITGIAYEKKLDALDKHVSQVYEFVYGDCPVPVEDVKGRREWLRQMAEYEIGAPGKRLKERIVDVYGKKGAESVEYIEAFEVSEHGARLTPELRKRIFPFVPAEEEGAAINSRSKM